MKRRVCKAVLGSAVLLGLAIGGYLWHAHRRATAIFEWHDALVKEMIHGIRARPTGHPVLFEPAQPGDGWASYSKGVAAIGAMPPGEMEVLPRVNGDTSIIPDVEKIDAILQKYASAVDDLRRSARHPYFIPPYPY